MGKKWPRTCSPPAQHTCYRPILGRVSQFIGNRTRLQHLAYTPFSVVMILIIILSNSVVIYPLKRCLDKIRALHLCMPCCCTIPCLSLITIESALPALLVLQATALIMPTPQFYPKVSHTLPGPCKERPESASVFIWQVCGSSDKANIAQLT